MQTEIEAKFLNTDHDAIRAKLKKLGAKLEHPKRLMRRRNFDFQSLSLDKINGWVRVRDEGDKITMTYKQLDHRGLHGTKEVNLTIDDYEQAKAFLEAVNLECKSEQETTRESWSLDGVQIELDEWPWIKPFIELEAKDEAGIKQAAKKLGLDWSKATHGSVELAYQAEYDVTDAEIDSWPEIKFIPVPDWLEKKRK